MIHPVAEALQALDKLDRTLDAEPSDPNWAELTEFEVGLLNGLRGIGYALLAQISGGQTISVSEGEPPPSSLEDIARKTFTKR